jgi:hypothetical protein
LVVIDVLARTVQVAEAPEIRAVDLWMKIAVAPAIVALQEIGNPSDGPFMMAGDPVIL